MSGASLWVSHAGAVTHGLRLSSATFPGHQQGAGREAAGTQALIWDASASGGGSACYAPVLAPGPI